MYVAVIRSINQIFVFKKTMIKKSNQSNTNIKSGLLKVNVNASHLFQILYPILDQQAI